MVDRRAAISCAAALILLMTLAGCEERPYGPSITARNDSARDVVVRLDKEKWEVLAGEGRFLAILPVHYGQNGVPLEILDRESCALIETARVSFEAELDPLLVIPPSGPATTRAITIEDREGFGPRASMDPNLCIGPADRLNLSVENTASTPAYLVTRDEAGEVVGATVEVPAGATGALAWTGVWGASGTLAEGAGTVILVDGECQPLSSVEYPAWGSFRATIDDGEIAIDPGPLPSGAWLQKADMDCGVLGLPAKSPASSP